MTTEARALAGGSCGSVKPKLVALKVWLVSSSIENELSGPSGASLTEVTSNVSVLASGSVLTPPLAVPPSSRTWKVKDV